MLESVDIWSQVRAAQPAPDRTVVVTTVVIAAALVVSRRAWSITRYAVTIAHEAAHGVVALAGGRRLAGIRLHADSSGVTLSRGRPEGPGMVAMLAAGYLGPALIGLGAAAALAGRHAVALLWGLLVLLALLLLQIRNFFGLWSVLVTGVAVFAVSWWLPGRAQSAFAYLVTWFLLLGALRSVLALVGRRRRSGLGLVSDPDQLARISPLPAGAWVALFVLGTLGALVGGGALLLR
ncbi:MAG: M50 family metallopeptidase [Actinomycetota bacterium]|nr:M50 family metallopeptidase [Actinomycetota bacterium]